MNVITKTLRSDSIHYTTITTSRSLDLPVKTVRIIRPASRLIDSSLICEEGMLLGSKPKLESLQQTSEDSRVNGGRT